MAHILLMGLRGSGKSTVAALLAERLALPHADLDTLTMTALAADSITDAWERHGEATFRNAERDALAAALETPPHIIALGGGTPTAPAAADLLRKARAEGAATIFYLRADAPTLRARLASDPRTDDRPSLTGAGTLDEIAAVLAQRDPLYRELADHVIEVSELTPEETADAIAALLRK